MKKYNVESMVEIALNSNTFATVKNYLDMLKIVITKESKNETDI